MSNKSQDKNNGNSFEYRLREVSDEEIISILRYREHFQANAVNAAIKEALKRKLISSVEDLDNDEFKPQALPPRSLFPLGATEIQNFAIFRSLCRIFYGFGLLPILFGIFKLVDRFSLGAVAAIITGLLIIFIANRLDKTRKPFYSNLMMAFNLPALGFAIYYLSASGNPSTMDAVAIAIVLLVMLYTTFFANKLTAYFNPKDETQE